MDLLIKLKKLNTKAVVPSYAHDGDAGMDLVATSKWFEGNKVCYGTGIAMETYTLDNGDQYDWNKLFGVSFGLFGIHKDSVRKEGGFGSTGK